MSLLSKSVVEKTRKTRSEGALEGDIVKLMGEDRDKTKGRNVSGRSWKVRPQKRASSLVTTKANNRKSSWEAKRAQKLAQQQAKQLQQELSERKRLEAIEKKERRLENERRRQENEFRNAQQSAQTLNYGKVGSTLKAMSKKQLRQVKKTRMNTKTGVVEYVPAYSK